MGRRIRGVVVGVACCFFHRMSEKVSLIKITFEQSCEKSSGKRISDSWNSRCKGPEVGICFMLLGSSTEGQCGLE